MGRGTPLPFFDKQNEQFRSRLPAFAQDQPWGVWGCTIFTKQPRRMSWLRCAGAHGGEGAPPPGFPRFEWELQELRARRTGDVLATLLQLS